MVQRRPRCRVNGRDGELPVGDKCAGHYAKAFTTTATGTFTHTIPAGYFSAMPILTAQPVVPGATRDHVCTLTGVTFNADKTVTVTGFVRRSQVLLVLADPFVALPTQVSVHLIAQEAD